MFPDCCSHVLVQYTNDTTQVYRNVRDGFVYSDLFTVFEREKGTTNERDHYKSLDGKYAIEYYDCGGWAIRSYTNSRYDKLRTFVLASYLM